MTDLLSWGQYFLGHKNYTIKQYSLEPPTYSKIGFSATGQSIVIGDPTATSQLVGQIFGSSAEETTLESLTDVKGIAK